MINMNKFNNIITELCVLDITGVEIAKKYNLSEARISQIKKKIKLLKHRPRIEDNNVVCYLCGSNQYLGFHEDEAILCKACTFKYGKEGAEEWKEGFKELYDFFQDIMKNINIIKNKEKWNDLLQKRNLVLIDKLRGEL